MRRRRAPSDCAVPWAGGGNCACRGSHLSVPRRSLACRSSDMMLWPALLLPLLLLSALPWPDADNTRLPVHVDGRAHGHTRPSSPTRETGGRGEQSAREGGREGASRGGRRQRGSVRGQVREGAGAPQAPEPDEDVCEDHHGRAVASRRHIGYRHHHRGAQHRLPLAFLRCPLPFPPAFCPGRKQQTTLFLVQLSISGNRTCAPPTSSPLPPPPPPPLPSSLTTRSSCIFVLAAGLRPRCARCANALVVCAPTDNTPEQPADRGPRRLSVI